MKLVIQRVKRAKVTVKNKTVGKIGRGLVVLVGVKIGDGGEVIEKMAEKVLKMRIFENQDNKFDQSIEDVKGEILVVPQFTLYAELEGRRPYFGEAAKPEIAKPLFKKLIMELKRSGLKIESGVFGAKMEVELVNNGPVTIIAEA
ncbi:MAG: D-aminoacyl-tRNA deacylase [Candidatus Shapirobacteria bacterium]